MLLYNQFDFDAFTNVTIKNSLISDGRFNGVNGNFGGIPALGSMYELLPGSIGIDAGNNLAANLPAFDIVGNPRIFDGDGDGVARVDVGAFELVPEPGTFWVTLVAFVSVSQVSRRKRR